MGNLRGYRKYYFLESYLFEEVTKNFQKRGCLNAEEFLAIVIWKRRASVSKVSKGVMRSGRSIEGVTRTVVQKKSREEQLKELCSIRGIGIAIASAILTVCYPKTFTVLDYRALNSLRKIDATSCGALPHKIEYFKEKHFFRYVDICEETRKTYDLSLRDFDRVLWAKDFYDGDNGLKELAAKLSSNLLQ